MGGGNKTGISFSVSRQPAVIHCNVQLETVKLKVTMKLVATLRGSRPWGAIRVGHYDVIDDAITQKL